MARFAGEIGFSETVEVRPGVYKEKITRRTYYGDFNRKGSSLQENAFVNDDIRLSNAVSVLADEFLYENSSRIRFVSYAGTDWKISSIEIARPRITLYFGGAYSGSKT